MSVIDYTEEDTEEDSDEDMPPLRPLSEDEALEAPLPPPKSIVDHLNTFTHLIEVRFDCICDNADGFNNSKLGLLDDSLWNVLKRMKELAELPFLDRVILSRFRVLRRRPLPRNAPGDLFERRDQHHREVWTILTERESH